MMEGFALFKVVCDEDGEPCDIRFLDLNPAIEQQIGWKREDIIGRNCSQILPEDALQIRDFCKLGVGGKTTIMEVFSRALKRYFQVIAYSPAPLQLAILSLDITEKKKSEDQLTKIEGKVKAILDLLPNVILHLTEEGIILDCSNSQKENCIPSLLFPGRSIDEIFPSNFASRIKTKMKEAQKTPGIQTLEYKLPFNGDKECHEVRIALSSDGTFVALMRNIEKGKRMEQALQESERRFRVAIDNFPYTFIIYNRDLRITYINRVGLEMCGMKEEEVVGHTDEDLFSASITGPYMESLRRAQTTGTMESMRCVQKLQSGKVTIVFNYVPILDEQGRVCQILGINFDITEIDGARRELERALAENEMQNRLLQTAMEELSVNYREMEELLFKISRELIVPLSTIEGFLGLLRKDVEKCNRIRLDIDIGLIGDAISRMQTLVGNALEWSSLGSSTKSAEDFSFAEVVEDVMNHFEERIALGDISITVDRDLPLVHASKNRVADVLMSIIESCIKFSSQGEMPVLHIGHFRKDDESIFFARSKNKKKAEIPEDIFSSDWENDGTIPSSSSGLAMAKRIIESQGGRMWMESGPEVGCAILFTLPEPQGARL